VRLFNIKENKMPATKKSEVKDGTTSASKDEVSIAFEKLLEAKEHFKLAAEAAGVEIKDEATDKLIKGQSTAEELSKQATKFASEKPMLTLGIAFASGFVLSQLFSRK
jgi:ElaB/YqjD/DUF883 family membrane-anchored ribosome-binding protein